MKDGESGHSEDEKPEKKETFDEILARAEKKWLSGEEMTTEEYLTFWMYYEDADDDD